jgi:hypothetical protein
MYKHLFKKNNFSGRALLLLGVYFLHFAFIQIVVAGFSDSNHLGLKVLFSNPKKNTNPNSGIATFRILEKHKAAQQSFKLSPGLSESVISPFDILSPQVDRPITQVHSSVCFHFSDTSYRLYAMSGVFRI